MSEENQNFKQLLEYIKFIISLTISWLGIISAIFFFFLWRDRQDMREQIEATQIKAQIAIDTTKYLTLQSIKRIENLTSKSISEAQAEANLRISKINKLAELEASKKVEEYFNRNDIENLITDEFEKVIIPKVKEGIQERSAELNERIEINQLLERIQEGLGSPMKDLKKIYELSSFQTNKTYIKETIYKYMSTARFNSQFYNFFKNSSNYADSTYTKQKTQVIKTFNINEKQRLDLFTTYYCLWYYEDSQLGFSQLVDYHYAFNIYFGTEYGIFEFEKMIQLIEPYAKDYKKMKEQQVERNK